MPFFFGRSSILWTFQRSDDPLTIVASDFSGRRISIFHELPRSFGLPEARTDETVIITDNQAAGDGGAAPYVVSEMAPMVRKYMFLQKPELSLLNANGITSVVAKSIVNKFFEKNISLVGDYPDGELGMAGFNLFARIGNTEIGLRGRRCLYSSAIDPLFYGGKLYCLKALGVAKERGQFGFTPDGQWLVNFDGAGIESWRIFENIDILVQEGRRHIGRCLTPEEREKLLLPKEPPAWCVTGSGDIGEPTTWTGKWPYEGKQWRDWLSAVIEAKAHNATMPPLPPSEVEAVSKEEAK